MMDEETKQFYNLTAESTADRWYKNTVLMPSIQDFVSLLAEKPRILDLGCGPGYESLRLASTGAKVIGVDFSTECIRIAKERCPQCQFEVMDFRQLDGERLGKFDGVFACASLIHIDPGELPDVLEKVASVLKQDGYLVAIVRDGDGIRETWPVVDGRKMRRIVYLHPKESLILLSAPRFSYVRKGYLADELLERGWQSYIFKVES
ncbi:MAG: class I SAM-dependent methyltransferase [Aestuariibacter sp.]|nr:class I SAM-dependent methyltransferase [Aestuariibacter sp.]